MTDAARRVVSEKSTVTPRVGRYVGNDGPNALVDLGDQRVPVPFLTGMVPAINEPVHVWSIDGSLYMLGPTAPKPGVGVISTITGNQAVVTTDFGDFPMTVAPTDPMPSSGDWVGISWSSQPWCTLLVDVPDPATPPPSPGGGGGGQVKTAEFRTVDAGSTDRHQSRWWTDQPHASNSTFGAFMYGWQIKDTIPAGAVFESLQVYVSWHQRQGGAPRWVLHDLKGRTGVPSVSAYTEWVPGSGYQTPPGGLAEAWFNALKDGGPWSGIGLNQGGYNIFKSRAQDGMTGALLIKWR